MAETRGTAITHSWLITAATEQADLQEQFISQVMRTGVDNWFADTTVQLIANIAIGDR